MKPLTVKLNNGVEVLAKQTKSYGISAITFANRTQAEKAAVKFGGWVWQGMSRPFYVRFDA